VTRVPGRQAENLMALRNRTIYIGDNLKRLRGIDGETVDLIYLDPPSGAAARGLLSACGSLRFANTRRSAEDGIRRLHRGVRRPLPA